MTHSDLLSPIATQHNGSWLALLSTTFACFAIVTGEFLVIGVLNNIAQDFQISAGTAGLTVTATAVAGMLASLLIPVYAKTLDRRYVLLSLVLLMIVANLITALAKDFNWLLLARFALGIALGGFWGIAAGLVVRLAPAHIATATAVTVFFSAVTLVTVLGLPLGTWIADHYGWRTSFMLLVMLGIFIFIVQCFSLPSLKPSSTLRWKELLLIPSDPIARKGLIIFTLTFLAHFAAYNYFAAFFKQTIGLSPAQINTLLLICGIGAFFGNLISGYLGNINVRYNFALSALLLAVTFFALPIWGMYFYFTVLLTFLWGFASGMLPASVNIWMYVHVPHLTEKGSALITFMFLILITLGSVIGGYLMDDFGGTVLMFSLLPLTLLALLLVFTLARGIYNR